MSSHHDMFNPPGTSYSDYDRVTLRNHQYFGHQSSSESPDSLYGSDQYFQGTGFTSYDFQAGNDPWTSQYMPYNSSESMFPDDFLNLDAASSNASQAPSLYDGESFVQSPTSPTFSSAVSACSGAMSNAMSPEMSLLDPTTPSAPDFNDDTMSELADSDEVLENLLGELEATEDGKYRCYDVHAEDHSCNFVADRKCMLRKHLESTLKTNICRHPDCRTVAFSSKAVLTRHEKEAHGMHSASQYFCPVPTCERATRGFPREYNMGDHIQRVHRELDVNHYLKKSKRSRKQSIGNTSAGVVSSSKSSNVVSGVRKNSSSRARREKLERQYKNSRENIGKLYVKLTAQSSTDVHKYIQQMKSELTRLEDVAAALGASAND